MPFDSRKRYQTLRTRFHSDVFEITFDRPASYNAVNFRMIQELHDILDMLLTCSYSKVDPSGNSGDQPRVVFLSGLGEAFSVGVDIKEADSDPEWDFGGLHSQQLMSKIIEKVYNLPQVVISLIHGTKKPKFLHHSTMHVANVSLECRASRWPGTSNCFSIGH